MDNKELPIGRTGFEILKEDNYTFLNRFLPIEMKNRRGVIRAMSVACGLAPEAEAVQKLLPNAVYLGIDKSSDLLKGARLWNPTVNPDNFREGDASDPRSFGDKKWDLIILKNPQIKGTGTHIMRLSSYIDPKWEKILHNCTDYLEDKGYLVVTSKFEEEIETVLEFFMKKIGIDPIVPKTVLPSEFVRSSYLLRDEFISILRKSSLENI